MRAIVQRVSSASVAVGEGPSRRVVGKIGAGLILFLGVSNADREDDAVYMAEKIAGLRIFMDREEKMNLSLMDLGYEALAITQFTLYGDARKGRRPSFNHAAGNDAALELYESFVRHLRARGIHTEQGAFGQIMHIQAALEGPVSILLDSEKMF